MGQGTCPLVPYVNWHVREVFSPRAVDNYISTFQGVLILRLFGVTPRLMARLLQKSSNLIKEHLALVHRFYPDEKRVRQYLLEQGVKV